MPKRGNKNKTIHKKIAHHSKRALHHVKDHFVKHEGNNHHPHVLKHHVLLGYSLILILVKILAVTVSLVLPDLDLYASAITPVNILALTNSARAAIGIPGLTMNAQLSASAAAKAQDMLKNQYFAHHSPSGVSPWYWIKWAGYDYQHSAENLAVHFNSSESVYNGWMASASHKKNIVNPDFIETGVGIAMGEFEGVDTIFVVQHFGKPAIIEPKTEPVTETEPEAATDLEPEAVEADLTNTETKPEIATAFADPTPPKNPKSAEEVFENDVDIIKIDPKSDEIQVSVAGVSDQKKEIKTKKIANNAATEPSAVITEILNDDGRTIEKEVAWISNDPSIISMFSLAEPDPGTKIFGLFSSRDIQKISHGVYAFFTVFLLGSLLLYLFVKMHIKKVAVIAHALSVIGLAVVLLFVI
ncbi:MAG: CAP domain-containing protein [Patescibacteria group bacterium]